VKDQDLHTAWTHLHLSRSRSCLLFFFGVSLRFNSVQRRRNRHLPWRLNNNSIFTAHIHHRQLQDIT